MFPDLMVDLETTSTDAAFGAIIQIAGVRFNYETAEIGPSFVASLEMAHNKFWDESTRTWWMGHLDVYNAIVAEAQPPGQVMKAFSEWCHSTGPALAGVEQRLWAKPSSFEWPFLQSYCRQFEVSIPFHYRNCIDLNSFTRGLQNKPGAQPIDRQFKIEFVGDAHNALHDVLHQIKQALMAKVLIDAA
jgi:DNA polymerase III epsilon subunit-like protein